MQWRSFGTLSLTFSTNGGTPFTTVRKIKKEDP
jgi:hypothetical protein